MDRAEAEGQQHGLNALHAATLKVFEALRESIVKMDGRLVAAEKRIAELESQSKKRQRRKVSQ